jgi:hypothetical protein
MYAPSRGPWRRAWGGRSLQGRPLASLSRGPRSGASVYTMRMARVNITVPDELLDQARAAGLNVSRLAAGALAEELDRRAKIAELDAYLAALDAELGPVPEQELDGAREWADAVLAADRPAPSRSDR